MVAVNQQRGTPDVYAEPAWDVALLFPAQGAWSEDDYLALETNQLVEFSHGRIEVLPMPTDRHQAIVGFLYLLIRQYTRARGGVVRMAPLRIRLWQGKLREPDLLFLGHQTDTRRQEAFWTGADLVVEVVSPDDPKRDLVDKRREYAQAGIPEYWIVNPHEESITVLQLATDRYVEHGIFTRGAVATSATLMGFAVPVDDVLDAD